MPTTLGGKKIVTKGSGHTATTPPATSMGPPPPPTGPSPVIVPYIVKSSSGAFLHECSKIGSDPVACKDDVFDVEPPANVGTQATGADVVSHIEKGKANAAEGDGRLHVDSKEVCTTGHMVRANMATGQEKISQVQGPWMEGVGTNMATDDASGANAGIKGTASDPDDALSISDPVAVATGKVIDGDLDLFLPGLVDLAFRRAYTSANAGHKSAMGRGGWSHSFDLWIAPHPTKSGVLELFAADGRRIWFADVAPGDSTFHRRERLRLTRTGRESFTVYDLDDRLTRVFSPVIPGGRAVLRAVRDLGGAELALVYEGDRLAKIVDTADRELRLAYTRGLVSRAEVWAEGKLEQWFDYAYGLGGELASATDPEGNAERYEYDGRHRMVKKTLRNGVSFHYEWEGERCARVFGDGGLQPVELFFDDEARTTTTAGNEEPRRYTWDAEGFVTRVETLDGAWVLETEYDADHYPIAVRNAAGEEIRYEHDELGNRVKATDAAGNVTEWQYEEERLVKRVDPDGRETVLRWDARGYLESVRDPTGFVRSFAYDHRARPVREVADGRVVRAVEYDAHHNVKRVDVPGGPSLRMRHDALGRVIESEDGLGNKKTITYDRLARPILVEGADGSFVRRAYDARGQLVRQEDAEGRVFELGYAGTGVCVKIAEPSGQVHRLEYDALERLRRITNPRLETHEITYDRVGRVIEEKTFDDRRTRFTWSLADRLARIDGPDGVFRVFTYDPNGFVTEDRTADGVITFERDPLGFVISATVTERSGKVVVAFERDDHHRVVRETVNGRATSYAYDARGRVARRELPNGMVTRFAYDEDDRLTALDHRGFPLSFEHDRLGRLSRIRLDRAGAAIELAHDARHRLSGEAVIGPDGRDRVRRHRWFDRLGRPLSVEDARWGTTRYAHDELGRLTEERHAKAADFYDYDPSGALQNMLTDDPLRSGPWALLTGDVLVRAGEIDLAYDARRRRVRAAENLDDGGQKITRYRWDHRDRLREVILANGDRVRFTYDAFARRVKKEIVPAAAFAPTDAEIAALLEEGAAPIAPRPRTVEYVWDRGDLALEIDSERGERAFVALPSGAPLLHDEGGEIFTAVTDPVGVPRELLDEEGRVAWAGRFNAWGRLLEEQPREAHPVRPPFRLLGQFADEETDLAYTRFRYWDAPVAHWISPDPAGLAGGPDLFGYNGNPLLHPDPLGLACYLINNTAAASFVDGKYTSRTLTHEEVMWRAGVKGKPYGQYFSHDEPTSVAQVRRDKAVLPVWPNGDASPMDAKHQHIVRPGTRVYEGVVAPQTGNDGTVYPGGTPQVFIPRGVHGSSLTPIAEKDLT